VLPARGGVRVRFQDMVRSGFAPSDFVRVLQRQMSPLGAASLWLPCKGTTGVVGILDGGTYVWLGALPYLNANQVDPSPDVLYVRHQSGTTVQVRQNGDMEVLHPSGTRLTMSQDGAALPALQNTSNPQTAGNSSAPVVQLAHASGALLQIDAEGHGVLQGFASLAFQGGSAQFCMDALVDWLNAHTHGNGNLGSPTTGPVVPAVKATVCSPTTFTGPVG
jgi:hypothetical protein